MASCSKCGEKKRTVKGYIVLPCFKVKVCEKCGEVEALWGDKAEVLFKYIFQYFWAGKVHITEE